MAIDVYKEWLGIPDGPRPPDYYALLRLVMFEDDVGKIRANYKKLNAHVRKYATGQYQNESQDLLNELAKAMLCLTDEERKRDYDVGLGREFPEEQLPGGRKTLERLLIERKQISQAQAKEAHEFADRSGLSLRNALVQMKLVEPEVAAQALADELGLAYVELHDMLPDDDVLDQVSRDIVKQHSILPLFIDQDRLMVACVDLIDHELEDELRLRFNLPVRSVIASPMAINQGIAKYYGQGMRQEPKTSGKKNGKPAPSSPASSGKPAPRPARTERDNSPEAQAQRKQLGIIGLCWSVIGSALLNYYVIGPYELFDLASLGLSALIVGGTAGAVWWTCFKD